MKRALVLLLCASAATAMAQDSSFSRLRLRGALLLPESTGRIADDWTAQPGLQLEAASNVGPGELSLGAGRVGFDPVTAKPAFTETLFSLSWTAPLWQPRRGGLYAGARLTDIRMDFDDPTLVGGLRTEEETMLAAVARARLGLGRRFSGFGEVTYGAALHSTRTPMLFVAVGLERDMAMPAWLRGVLR